MHRIGPIIDLTLSRAPILRLLLQLSVAMELSVVFASLMSVDEHAVVPEAPDSLFRQQICLEEYRFLPRQLRLIVDAGPGCGGRLWPAALVLSRYCAWRQSRDATFLKRDIVELGSGTGVVALAVGMLEPSARVTATDIGDLCPLMRENVKLNGLTNVDVLELPWGQPTSLRPSLVLAADCVYFEPAFPLLVDTLASLLQDGATCVFCYKRRRKADKRFFQLLRRKLNYEEVLDDPEREAYRRDGIYLYTISARRPLGTVR